MCGVFFATLPGGEQMPVDRVLAEIQHRGPDGSGVFHSKDGRCHLGHARLSIIDLSSAGTQPMADASGRYVISYNGEVYNFRDLRQALEARHGAIPWKSTTDTEVIVEGVAREGISFLSRLNGIFALAIYDTHSRALHVLRDPLGIKPLFCTRQGGGAYFCSELKGLLAIPGLQRSLRRQSLAAQLAYMYVPEPYTLYEEFFKVTPGVCSTYLDGAEIDARPLFEHLSAPLQFDSEAQMVERFSQSLSTAVERQLVADVPVSLMLSGGLDSSAVAHEVLRHGGTVRDAYTISCSDHDRQYDQQSDDLRFARLMAQRLGIELKVIPARANFIELLPRLSRFLEDGISDPAAINSYLICEAARRSGVKVMLSGQGADEFLGGYRRYAAERMLKSLPGGVRTTARWLGNHWPAAVPGRFNAVNRRLKRLLLLAGEERPERLINMYIWTAPEKIAQLFVQPAGLQIAADIAALFDRHGYSDVLDTMMRVDQQFDLMSLNLTYTDRMSMAVGVEARVPFLDFDLVRVMNAIPTEVKMKGGVAKYVLKKAMEPHLPHEVIYREKAGFSLPIRSWMRSGNDIFRHYLDPKRLRDQGIFDAGTVQTMYEQNLSGGGDYSNVLFSMLCIQVWLESQSNLSFRS